VRALTRVAPAIQVLVVGNDVDGRRALLLCRGVGNSEASAAGVQGGALVLEIVAKQSQDGQHPQIAGERGGAALVARAPFLEGRADLPAMRPPDQLQRLIVPNTHAHG
jgi:hypothetical protein